jgi:hypothetical protein
VAGRGLGTDWARRTNPIPTTTAISSEVTIVVDPIHGGTYGSM